MFAILPSTLGWRTTPLSCVLLWSRCHCGHCPFLVASVWVLLIDSFGAPYHNHPCHRLPIPNPTSPLLWQFSFVAAWSFLWALSSGLFGAVLAVALPRNYWMIRIQMELPSSSSVSFGRQRMEVNLLLYLIFLLMASPRLHQHVVFQVLSFFRLSHELGCCRCRQRTTL